MKNFSPDTSHVNLSSLVSFPCNEEKRPRVAHGFKNARRADWQSPLVGVPTGAASGLDVLDIDPEGRGWYEANFSALPLTQAHETQRGGLHLLFRHAEGLRCSAGRIAAGVDVRADGGYVVWWPRQGLPAEQWPICEWPGWLLKEAFGFRGKQSEAAGKNSPHDGMHVRGDCDGARPTTGPVGYRLTGIMRTLDNARKGERNRVLYWAAMRMAEMVGRGEVRVGIARRLLEAGCQANGLWRDPEDGPEQCRQTIASAFGAVEAGILGADK
jgi:hypothetical protein